MSSINTKRRHVPMTGVVGVIGAAAIILGLTELPTPDQPTSLEAIAMQRNHKNRTHTGDQVGNHVGRCGRWKPCDERRFSEGGEVPWPADAAATSQNLGQELPECLRTEIFVER